MPRILSSLLAALLLAAAFCAVAVQARAGEIWKLEVTASDEVTTEVDEDGALTDETLEKEAKLTFQNTVIGETELKLEADVKSTDEKLEEDFDTSKLDVILDAELKGPWWSVTAGWEENVEKTDDPETNTTIEDSYDLEIKLEPEHDALPDLGFKIEGDDDQVARAYVGKFEYTLLEMFEFKLEGEKEYTSARDPADDNTDDRSYKMEMSFDRDLNESWKLETAWTNERTQNLTLDHGDHLLKKEDTLDNNFKGKLEYDPLEWIALTIERELDWSKDFIAASPTEEPTTETSDKTKGEIKAEPELTEFLDLKLDFIDEREKKGGTDTDEDTWNQEYSAELIYEPMEIAKLSATYDGKIERTFPEDPAEENARDHSDEYGLEGEVKFWEDQINLKAKRTFTYKWESGLRSGRERNWEFEGEWKYENFPNLKFTPKWTQKKDEDLLEATADLESTISLDIEYIVELGDVTKVDVKHTYERTSFFPDGEVHYIERSDDSSVKVELNDFLEGMKNAVELTRKATDKSEDDEGPEVDYKVTWEYTWTALEIYELTLKYEYDMPDESENKKTYEASLKFPFFLEHFDVNLEYSHDTQVEGETSDTHRYLIELKGEF
jgi:hypothetical protein